MVDRPVHFVIRYRNPTTDLSTIRLHQEVIDRRGGTWVAQVGKGLSKPWAAQLMSQAAHGAPAFLFLVGREDGQLRVHRGAIELLSYSTPTARLDFPQYYSALGIESKAKVWVYVSELLDVGVDALEEMVVVSSGRPILESLQSTSPTFIVATR
jgi:hypothetical protein